jgi:tetratricopeptide (TPR) repeat protein
MGVKDANAPQSAGATPLVLIPVTAEDVARRKRNIALAIIGAVIVGAGAAWYVYQRLTVPVEARQAYANGVRLMQANRYEQAVLNFDRTIRLMPKSAEAYRNRGKAYILLSKPDEAIADFTRTSQLLPNDAPALVERGFAYLEKKNWKLALEDAEHAISLDPKLARAYNLRATAHRSMGNLREALEDYSKAIGLDPSLDNYFQRASTHQMLKEHSQAVEDLNQAIEYSPDQPALYFARAESRAALGDKKAAAEDVRKGRQIDGW